MASEWFEKLRWRLILPLVRRLPDCKTITPKLGESLDRRPMLKDRIVIRLHLLTCEACRLYLDQIRFMRMAAQRYDEYLDAAADRSNAVLSEDVKARLKQELASPPDTA